jgi:hypothetical protein
MNVPVEYRVLSAIYTKADAASFHDRLSKQVNDFVRAGWQPFGSMATANLGEALIVMQPVVKYEDS